MVTWRGVGCGVRWPEGGVERVWVGSVTERTRVEKKKKEKHDVPSWMVLAR